jgi:NADPH-dependent 2,4-dienoyl-CoA reductase/sulfur reductase-like enzyme
MKRLFKPTLYPFDQHPPCYREASAGNVALLAISLSGAQGCDVAILGGGFSGLSAALDLTQNYIVAVAILEAGHFG